MCDCIEKVNEQLEPLNGKVGEGAFFNKDMAPEMKVLVSQSRSVVCEYELC